MPTYLYSCILCGEFETEHSISTKLEKCPKCLGSVERLITSSSFILKGGMWGKSGYSSEIREAIRNLPEAEDDDE